MGQVTNPIAMHLGLTTFWHNLFVGKTFYYKTFVLGGFIITKICKKFFTNYSIPEAIIGKPRNDKSLAPKERNIKSSLVPNSFVLNNIIYGDTTIIKENGLLVKIDLLDANLLTRKERAAFMIKKHGNLPLNKKAALIEYAEGFKIMKFGVVGIKIFLLRKNIRSSYYEFLFSNKKNNLC